MKHIFVRNGASVSYKVDPLFKADFRTFGHNKLAVGQWWPMLVAAFRDGAHGKCFLDSLMYPTLREMCRFWVDNVPSADVEYRP